MATDNKKPKTESNKKSPCASAERIEAYRSQFLGKTSVEIYSCTKEAALALDSSNFIRFSKEE